jgi:FkbH-like protein
MRGDPGLARDVAATRADVLPLWWATQFDPDRIARYAVAGTAGQSREAMIEQFVGPLFDLLVEYIRTGDASFADVYLDERLRYAPHLAAPEVRAAFFAETLDADEAVVVARVPRVREVLASLHAPLRQPPAGRPIRMLAVGDCLMSEVRLTLARQCADHGIALDLRLLYFSALMGRDLSVDNVLAFLRDHPTDLIALSFLSYEGIPPYAALMRDADGLRGAALTDRVAGVMAIVRGALDRIREATDATVLLHNASGLPLTRYRRRIPLLAPLSRGRVRALGALNLGVAELADRTPNVVLVDEAAVAATHGLRDGARSYLPGHGNLGVLFHTARFGVRLSPVYADVIRSYATLSRAKVLAVDFDHTLWAGVMADGPVEHRRDVQLLLKQLKDAGILLVAVSKNDPANIRWDEMALTPDDFVLHKISWDLKVNSIRDAANQLNLGLDAFTLIDDNPAERDLVRTQLPAVQTLDPTTTTAVAWLERMLRFPITRETEEARTRTEMYRAQAARSDALATHADYPALMASLGLEARIAPATARELDRVVELVQRTNQFNTTTIRYTRDQLRQMVASPTRAVYVGSLADKFGSVGLVAVAAVDRQNGDGCVIESFVMSCRAMGFGLERLMMAEVIAAEERRAGSAVRVVGRFVPTDRNGPSAGLYGECGFAVAAEGAAGTEYVLAPDAERPASPPWFTIRTQ